MDFEEFSEVLEYMKEMSEKGWIIYMTSGKIYAVRDGVLGKSFECLKRCKQFIEENDVNNPDKSK